MVDIRELVMQAIGEASVCWSNLEGAGVFDSSRASNVGERLIAALQGTKERPANVNQQLKAEIAAKIEHAIRHLEDKDLEAGVFELMQLKRQLSAV